MISDEDLTRDKGPFRRPLVYHPLGHEPVMKGYWILRAGSEHWSRQGWSDRYEPVVFRTEYEARRAMDNLQSDREVRPVHVLGMPQ